MIFNVYIEKELNQITMKKKNEFTRDAHQFIELSRNQLEFHFNRNPQTVQQNYLYFDALVWSIVYFEKLPRYSDQVYKMAEYLINTYKYLQDLEFNHFLFTNVHFDVSRISWSYKQKFLAINPLQDENTFIQQFQQDLKNKHYYYSHLTKQEAKLNIVTDQLYNQKIKQDSDRII